MALTAPTVSKALRTAGFPISQDRNRQGVRVSRGALPNTVCVAVDLDRPGEARRMVETLVDWLAENATSLGWSYRRNDGDNSLFRVWRREPLPVEQANRLQRDSESGKLAAEVTASTTRLRQAIYNGTTPAQADITAARTALEALIALAGGDQ